MMEKTISKTRLVFIGGGASHIYILSKLIKEKSRNPNLEIILISPTKSYFYPGMSGGFIEDVFHAHEFLIDLEAICHIAGAVFVLGDIAQIVLKERLVKLKNGSYLPFDILSVDINHHLEGEEIEGVKKFALPINTCENLVNLKKLLQNRLIDRNITIVGASGQAMELVFALEALSAKMGIKIRLTIIDASQSILQGYDYEFKNMIFTELKNKQIELILGRRITLVTEDFLIFDDRAILKHDYLIWFTDPVPGALFKDSGFTVDDKGFMVVNNHLRSIDASNIFGAGGSIRLPDGNYLKVNSLGFNEAVILLDNIKNRINRVPLKRVFNSSGIRLQTLSLGDSMGIFYYRPLVLKGKLGWEINNHLHKSFMRQLAE